MRKLPHLILATTAAVLLLAGCSTESNPEAPATTQESVAPVVTTTLDLPDGNAPVFTGGTVFHVKHASTVQASLKNLRTGKVFPLKVADNSYVTIAGKLAYGTRYEASATATSVTGEKDTKKVTFSTVKPTNLTMPYYNVDPGEKVGVGFSIAVRFDEPIEDRKAAQQSVTVTASDGTEVKPYWLSDKEMRLRPEHYWTPGTKISVSTNAYGTEYGPGLYGEKDTSVEFTVGPRVVSIADDKTKQVTVFKNNKVIRTMPTSMGKPGDLTQPGTYIVNDRRPHIIMDSSTYGVPSDSANGYRTPVDYATQVSYSGIYLHSAPWSMWAQGNTNTSHGCLNLSPQNAKWFMDTSQRGDVVKVVNTGGPRLSGMDGLGDWNIPWSTWSKGNA